MRTFQEIKDNYRFTGEDIETLKGLLPVVSPHADMIVSDFYSLLLSIPDTAKFLKDEAKLAYAIQADGYNFHCGSNQEGENEGIANAIITLNRLAELTNDKWPVKLILENDAGAGNRTSKTLAGRIGRSRTGGLVQLPPADQGTGWGNIIIGYRESMGGRSALRGVDGRSHCDDYRLIGFVRAVVDYCYRGSASRRACRDRDRACGDRVVCGVRSSSSDGKGNCHGQAAGGRQLRGDCRRSSILSLALRGGGEVHRGRRIIICDCQYRRFLCPENCPNCIAEGYDDCLICFIYRIICYRNCKGLVP